MSVITLASLVVKATKAQIYETGLAIASSLGVPVSTWQPGDPTRSLYYLEAEILEAWEDVAVGFINSGFLDFATGGWLKVIAYQVFGVTVPGATYASGDIRLTNTGGGVYDIEPNDLTFRSSLSNKTYHNTTGGHLAGGGGTLVLSIVADEAGAESTAGVGEINEMVTVLLGVSCTNTAALIGRDEQDKATTVLQCRDKLGSLSPNGPGEAYTYVARNPDLTGTNAVTRARSYGSGETGDVTLYIAGPAGAVSEPDRVLVEKAIATYATPLCITPTVLSAESVNVPVTYTLWVYKSVNKTEAEIEEDVATALQELIARTNIGGDIIPPDTAGRLYKTAIEAAIQSVNDQAFRVAVTLPAGDVALDNDQVAALGAITPTVNLVSDP